MPITQITLENFKGVGDPVTVPLRPITLLFGANSAGKSTLLQALLYLRELLERQNPDADVLPASGDSINLGGFRKFVHGHDLSRTVRIGVTITVDDDGLPDYRTGDLDDEMAWHQEFHTQGFDQIKTVTVGVDVSWDETSKRPWITSYEVSANNLPLARICALPRMRSRISLLNDISDLDPDWEQSTPTEPKIESLDLASYVIPKFGTPLIWEGGDPFPSTWLKIERYNLTEPKEKVKDDWIFGSERNLMVSRYVVGAGELVLKELQRIRYIGPIREVPSRAFAAQRTPDQSRWADGSAAWDWVQLKPEFLTESTSKEIHSLGLGYRIEPQRTFSVQADTRLGMLIERARLGDAEAFAELDVLPISELTQIEEHSRIRIVAEETGVEVAPCDIGVGVAQVLPVVIGSMAPGYSVLAVEQPELHVHPAVQTRLADVLARQVVGAQDRLLLLETHSEHLMLRLLRRVREHQEGESEPYAPEIKPEDLSVLYLSNESGSMKITELPVTPDGDFSRPWPKGFFAERTQELF